MSLTDSCDDAASVEAKVAVSSLKWGKARFLFVGAVIVTAVKMLDKKSVPPRAIRDAFSKLRHTV